MLVPKLPKLNRHRNKSGLQYTGTCSCTYGGSGQLWRHTQPQTDKHTHQSCPCFKKLYKVLTARPWQKKRALKFALKGSESFIACFELYRCLNPEKSFNSSFENDFWAFLHDFCSTMFWVVAWVQVEFRSPSSFRRCMLFHWLLLLLLLSKVTFSRDCVQGWWVPSSKVCFSAMADCIGTKSHALNRALKYCKSFKAGALNLNFSSFMKSFKCYFTMFFFVKAYSLHLVQSNQHTLMS